MKIALILPGSIWYAPYVRIYTKVLDEIKTDYSIISWNREGNDVPEGYHYDLKAVNGHGSAGLSAYRGYIKFVKKTIKEQRFDKLVVFGPQMACLLSSYLLCHFRNRYIIDYRDLSIEQKFGLKQVFAVMLRFSYANFISSPGFEPCLPNAKYRLSHNFSIDNVKAALNNEEVVPYVTDKYNILTIGAIRDLSSNLEVVKALVNKPGFQLQFVGKGGAADKIKQFAEDNGIDNISFKGFYQKQEEPGYIKAASMLNIFYPVIITHKSALSNRFYNALIFKKPMIVTTDSTQGDYIEKYNLGLSIANCEDLDKKIKKWFEQNDYKEFNKRCNSLLKDFLKDYEIFCGILKQFVAYGTPQ